MIYFKDIYSTFWEMEDRGNYSVVSLSTGRKDKKTNEFVNSNWKFVRFVGAAHEKVKELEKKDRIKINGGISWEPYLDDEGNKKWAKQPSLVVFDFGYPEERPEGSNMDKPPVVEEETKADDTEEMPF